MKKRKASRVLSALLTLAMLLTSVPALADMVDINATALYTLLRGEPSDSSTNNTLLPAGQYRVNTYNDSYYRMNVSGVDYYIKISDVQTLGTVPDSGSSGSTGGGTTSGDGTTSTGTPSLITGEKDATYANEILNFTVPAAGLFLYREASSTASPAASIAAGNAVKLTYVGVEQDTTDPSNPVTIETWYSTWYNNAVYYVKKSDLKADTSSVTVGKSYSLVLDQNVELFGSLVSSTLTETYPTGFYGNPNTAAGTLAAGTTVRVTVYQTKSITLSDEVGMPYTMSYPTWYSYETTAGTVYYFKNPGIDDIIRNALAAYTELTAMTNVPYYATKADAEAALGAQAANNANIVFSTAGTKFSVLSAKPTTITPNPATTSCSVVYDLQLDPMSKQSNGSYLYYSCRYYNANGTLVTGYIKAGDIDGGTPKAYTTGGLLANANNKTSWPIGREPLYGSIDANGGYNRITATIVIDPASIQEASVSGWFQADYRDVSNNLSKEGKTTYNKVYFQSTLGKSAGELKAGVNVFSSVAMTTDLDKFPSGWYGPAASWQGLYAVGELTNRANYKMQTRTVDGVKEYRVSWYRVQYVNNNGTVATGYYENPDATWYKLTDDVEITGGTAYDTTNGSGADTGLLKALYPKGYESATTWPLTVHLYTTKSKLGYAYQASFASKDEAEKNPIYGVREDDEWYRVTYAGGTYYVLATEVEVPEDAVAVSDGTLTSSAIYVTIGSQGAQLYTTANSATKYRAYHEVNGVNTLYFLPAGFTALVSKHSSGWYTYRDADGNTYYLASGSVASTAASGTTSSHKVHLTSAANVYEQPGDMTAARTIPAGYYAMQRFNNEYYSVRLEDGRKYYLEDTNVTEICVLPLTTTGKTYQAILGENGGYLFTTESAATKWGEDGASPDGYVQKLEPGTKITVQQVYSYLFLMTTTSGNRYVSIRDISAIAGSDDDQYKDSSTPSSGVSGSDVTAGKTDDKYADLVLSYTTPAGGLWLYSSMSRSAAEFAVAANVKINLSTAYNPDGTTNPEWYATWYNGKQYYALASDLQSNTAISVGKQYTITLSQNVDLYSQLTATTNVGDDPYGTGFYGESRYAAGTLTAGTYNVTAYKTLSFTAFDGNAYQTVQYPTWYSYVTVSGSTVYFKNPSLATIGFDRSNATSDNGAFGITPGINGTRLYYTVTRSSGTADGTYNSGTTSEYIVYAGLRASQTYSTFATFQYDNNYDPSVAYGWRNGRTTNDANHRGTGYNDENWNRVVSRERVTDIKPYLYRATKNADGTTSYAISWYQGTLHYNYNTSTGTYNGTRMVYFTASGAPISDLTGGTLLNASVTSGSSVNFTLSVPVSRTQSDGKTPIYLYATPSDTSAAVVKTQVTGSGITYLPGISYNDTWYKVVYNGEGWYVRKADITALGYPEASLKKYASNAGATMATYTVTIGPSGARLYSTPSTNSTVIYTNTTAFGSRQVLYDVYEQNAVLLNAATKQFKTLAAGQTVSASQYNSSWYTYGEYGGDGTLTTYYFMASAVANANDTSSVDSYVLTKTSTMPDITLYPTMSDLASNPITATSKLPNGTYTARRMNGTWSRVTVEGKIYYFKTAQIEGLYEFTASDSYRIRTWDAPLSGTELTNALNGAAGTGTLTAGQYSAVKYDAYFSQVTVGGKACYVLTEEATGRYTFTPSRSIARYTDAACTAQDGVIPGGTAQEAVVYNSTVSKYYDGTKYYYFKTEEATVSACSFTTVAAMDLYNSAKAVVYSADSGNGLPAGTYPSTAASDWTNIKRVDSEWISIDYTGSGSRAVGTYYVKASDIAQYQTLDVETLFGKATYKTGITTNGMSSTGLMTDWDVNFYSTSSGIDTGASSQAAYLTRKLGTLTNKTSVDNLNAAASTAISWNGVYNKAVRLNDFWGSVVIPASDPFNGRNYTYRVTNGTVTSFTQSTDKYAGQTVYFYHGGKWPAGTSGIVNVTGGYESVGVTDAMGDAIATVKDGGTYTITIGSNGAPVYNNAKLTGTPSATIPAGTTLQGVKLTAAYETATAGTYAYQSVYRVTFNGYTAFINAANVAGVAVGEDAAEREQEANQNQNQNQGGTNNETGEPDASVSEPLDIAVGDPPLSIVLAKTIAVYGTQSMSATTTTIPAGTSVTVTKVDNDWYRLLLNNIPYYIPTSALTMAQVSSVENITDGVGYITKMLSVDVQPDSTLNLRKSASTSSTIMAYLKPGTHLTNLGYTTDANNQLWYRVSYNNITGYVFGTYVVPVLTSSSSTNSTSDLSVNVGLALTVNTDQVNIRTGAGPSYSIIDRLAKNAIVVPTAVVPGADGLSWYKFTYNGSDAYIRYDYLSGGTSGVGTLSGNAAVRVNSVNMRSGAGLTFSVIGRLNKDEVVTILSTSTDSDGVVWYRITYGSQTGYVRNDLLRSLTSDESNGLINDVITTYPVLKVGSRGTEVMSLQRALMSKNYLPAGEDDGIYGAKTMAAVQAFQAANGLTANGVADATTQAKLYGTYTGTNSSAMKGNVYSLDWFANGYDLINAFPNISIYDCNTGIMWNAKYINGRNHADIIPASAADAQLLTAYNITGSYVRRPCIVIINGTKYAGSMYAVGHGTTSYCDWFSGVMCIHFTGSKTHTSAKVDADHQAAIQSVLVNYN